MEWECLFSTEPRKGHQQKFVSYYILYTCYYIQINVSNEILDKKNVYRD